MKGWWLSSPWRLWAIIPLAGQGGKPRKFVTHMIRRGLFEAFRDSKHLAIVADLTHTDSSESKAGMR